MKLWIRLTVGVFVTAVLIGAMLSQINIRSVFGHISRMGIAGAAETMLLLTVSYALRARRFQILLSSDAPPFPRLLGVTAVYMFMLRLLPFRAGEVSYLYLIRRSSDASLAKVGATLAVARVLDVVSVLGLFCAAAVFESKLLPGITANLFVTAAALLTLLWFLDRPVRGIAAVLRRMAGGRPGMAERLAALAGHTADEILGLRRRRAYFPAFLITVLTWTVVFLMFYVFLHSFGVNVSLATALCGSAAAVAASSLPVNGIGAFGPIEAGWALGFVAVGVDRQTAISTGIAMNLVMFCYATLLAGIGSLALTRFRR